jgi:hypothetical protein
LSASELSTTGPLSCPPGSRVPVASITSTSAAVVGGEHESVGLQAASTRAIEGSAVSGRPSGLRAGWRYMGAQSRRGGRCSLGRRRCRRHVDTACRRCDCGACARGCGGVRSRALGLRCWSWPGFSCRGSRRGQVCSPPAVGVVGMPCLGLVFHRLCATGVAAGAVPTGAGRGVRPCLCGAPGAALEPRPVVHAGVGTDGLWWPLGGEGRSPVPGHPWSAEGR